MPGPAVRNTKTKGMNRVTKLKRLMEDILMIFLLALLPDCMCYEFGVYHEAERIITKRRGEDENR